jgi:hypothetical protein
MLVSKETSKSSYLGWDLSYPLGLLITHICRSHGQVNREIGESLWYIGGNLVPLGLYPQEEASDNPKQMSENNHGPLFDSRVARVN